MKKIHDQFPGTRTNRVMIVAGEASGDLHGSHLVKAMQKKRKNLFFCGMGGQSMEKAGVRIVVDASKLSVVGITEVLSKSPSILRGMAAAKNLMRTMNPGLLILIDFPDFNLRLAATAKRLGIPVLYYVSPQIWAWRSGRVTKIRDLVDHMAVILPFEEKFYKRHNVPVTFAGHPILDTREIRDAEYQVRDFDPAAPVVGLLPGSRHGEISALLPVMLDAARILKKNDSRMKFILSIASSMKTEFIEDIVISCGMEKDVELVEGAKEIFNRCDMVVAASGTVTLEAAIAGLPVVVIYKVSPISYFLGKAMIRVSHISLVNLILGKEVAPELIQDMASPENIADKVLNILDPGKLEQIRHELLKIRKILGGPGASKRVADVAFNMLGI